MKATHQPTTTPVPDPMRPSALLHGAALYLQRHGWTKGQFFEQLADTDGPFLPACASGAIMTAAHGHCPLTGVIPLDVAEHPSTEAQAALTALRAFAEYLDPIHDDQTSRHYGHSAIDVIGDWNDEQGRTLAEVIEALQDAATDWETAHPTGGAR